MVSVERVKDYKDYKDYEDYKDNGDVKNVEDCGDVGDVELPLEINTLENIEFRKSKTLVYVEVDDALLIAKKLTKQGFEPAVVIESSPKTPGGCYRGGKNSYESRMYLRSDISNYIVEKNYPLSNESIYYIPDVEIQKDELLNYCSRDKVSVICASPIYNPETKSIVVSDKMNIYDEPSKGTYTKLIYYNKSDFETMKKQIFMMFEACLLFKNNVLIVSHYGCHRYGNPHLEVIRIFKEAIEKYPVPVVVFALEESIGVSHIVDDFQQLL